MFTGKPYKVKFDSASFKMDGTTPVVAVRLNVTVSSDEYDAMDKGLARVMKAAGDIENETGLRSLDYRLKIPPFNLRLAEKASVFDDEAYVKFVTSINGVAFDSDVTISQPTKLKDEKKKEQPLVLKLTTRIARTENTVLYLSRAHGHWQYCLFAEVETEQVSAPNEEEGDETCPQETLFDGNETKLSETEGGETCPQD